jgi:ribosome recycling factor
MSEELEFLLSDTEDLMRKAINHLETELTKIRAGKASPQMLEGIMVDYYGNPTPINQVANISALDARTIAIQPWEKNMLAPIERAILQANIGVTPNNDGNGIKLFMPPLTEERRKEFVKKANAEGEHSKVSIRNVRRDCLEKIKKMQKDGLSEDAAKDAEGELQELTNKFTGFIDKHLVAKEKEIMSI